MTIVHAQRADAQGNAQIWGLLGVQKEAAFASRRVIVVVEELVDESVIRADPNRTLIPGMIVDAVVVEPWGAHPSYAQGYYDRDNEFYVGWETDLARSGEAGGVPRRVSSTACATARSTWSVRRAGPAPGRAASLRGGELWVLRGAAVPSATAPSRAQRGI